MLEFHGLGETYPALSAAGERSHKYFWLAAWEEAESVTELLGSKEHALKHSGRIGQNTGHGGLSGSTVPSNSPHPHQLSPKIYFQFSQRIRNSVGRGRKTDGPRGHQSNVFSTVLRSILRLQLRTRASEKEIGLQGGGFPLGIAPGFECRARRLVLLQLNGRHTWTHASSVSSSSTGYRQL